MGCNYHKVKDNAELRKKESERIASYLNDKYKNDEEFRERKRLYQQEYRRKKKLEKELQNNTLTLPDIIIG